MAEPRPASSAGQGQRRVVQLVPYGRGEEQHLHLASNCESLMGEAANLQGKVPGTNHPVALATSENCQNI